MEVFPTHLLVLRTRGRREAPGGSQHLCSRMAAAWSCLRCYRATTPRMGLNCWLRIPRAQLPGPFPGPPSVSALCTRSAQHPGLGVLLITQVSSRGSNSLPSGPQLQWCVCTLNPDADVGKPPGASRTAPHPRPSPSSLKGTNFPCVSIGNVSSLPSHGCSPRPESSLLPGRSRGPPTWSLPPACPHADPPPSFVQQYS